MEAHSETTGKIKCFIFNCIGERRVHRMLLGKTIYLDLDDYKNCHFIESGLRERGAAIQPFLLREVRYIVTSGYRNTSPPNGNTSELQHNRSTKIVTAAKMRSTTSSDITQIAKTFNMKIIQVEDVVQYFYEYPVGTESSHSRDQHKSPGVWKLSGVRKLRSPYLKCEDLSRLYKPIFMEVKRWPQLNLDCGPGECPFDGVHGDMKLKVRHKYQTRSKYCECCACYVAFLPFDQHVNGDQHLSYASNFSSLDELYDRIPTLDQFIDAHAVSSPELSEMSSKSPNT